MAAKKSAATANRSDAVREYLSAHPGASQKEIAADLAAQGVKVSTSLINKIKYSKLKSGAKAKASVKGRRKVATHKVATHRVATRNGAAGTSKAQAIRDAFATLGRRTRPRDVIAHLLERGTAVSAAQVSALRKSLRKPGRPANGAPAAAMRQEIAVTLEHLLAAKKLADQVGIQAAKRAVDFLARLVSA